MAQSIIFIPHILCLSHRRPFCRHPYLHLFTLFCSGRFIEYVLERPDVETTWRGHTEHAFVGGLGDGTLPLSAFKYYLIQDYLFLVCCSGEFKRLETDHNRFNSQERMLW
jgi:hypothetical protein